MTFSPAERLLQRFGIDDPKDIDLEVIAWRVGAMVKYRPLDGCEAMIVGNDRNAVISVKSTSMPERRRFSIGHELGHWHHHRGKLLFCSGREIDCLESRLGPEKVADEFASDLLLPSYLFKPAARKIRRLNLKSARDLAGMFDASLSATLSKLVTVDLFPLMLVRHGQDGRKWFGRPNSVATYWFPRKDLDAESPAFELLFKGGREDAIPRKIGADAWFDFKGADRYEVQEQSFSLPYNEILTLLILPDSALAH